LQSYQSNGQSTSGLLRFPLIPYSAWAYDAAASMRSETREFVRRSRKVSGEQNDRESEKVVTYVTEPAVKFRCSACGVKIIAPQDTKFVVCTNCGMLQKTSWDHLEHFSTRKQTILYTESQYIAPQTAMPKLEVELKKLRRRKVLLLCRSMIPTISWYRRLRAIQAQQRAVNHLMKRLQEMVNL
jgi:hypothetical protein